MGKIKWTITAYDADNGWKEVREVESGGLSDNKEFFGRLFDGIYQHIARQIKYWTK